MEQATAIGKAVDVLYHLHGTRAPAGVTEVSRALGLPRSSVHRLLSALVRRGLVEQDEAGRYRPGIALVALGLGVLDREPLVQAARPVLERKAAESGETTFLTVARSGRIVAVDKVEGTGLLRASPQIGAEAPVHATAVGKIQLAFAPEKITLPKEPWPRFTRRTPTSWKRLRPEVERVRRRGWAENRDEWIPGLAVVAAPIFREGRLAGCFVIAGPESRVGSGGTARLARIAVAGAAETAARLVPPEVRS